MIVLISVIICFTVKNKYYKTINIFIKNTNKLVNTFWCVSVANNSGVIIMLAIKNHCVTNSTIYIYSTVYTINMFVDFIADWCNDSKLTNVNYKLKVDCNLHIYNIKSRKNRP